MESLDIDNEFTKLIQNLSNPNSYPKNSIYYGSFDFDKK